jgi:hypothetical protein
MADDRGGASAYAWTQGVDTVPDVGMDEDGGLIPVRHESELHRRRLVMQQRVGESIRRGMIRYVVLLVDWSLAMDADDYHPSRAEVVLQQCRVGAVRRVDRAAVAGPSLCVSPCCVACRRTLWRSSSTRTRCLSWASS